MKKQFTSLPEIRDEIDRIDNELLSLICARADCSLQVATIKQAELSAQDPTARSCGDESEPQYYRPEREAQILRRVRENNPGPLADEVVMRFFREIISASLALEQPLKVAYLGPEGTFTHAAALKHFGSSVQATPCTGIGEVFDAVQKQKAGFGVVPVENSTEGMVNHTLDLLMETSLKICGESRLRIEHNLLGTAADISAIKTVYAHPQALAQCRHWLDSNLPAASREPAASNALAADLVATDPSAAAIASTTAAELYGLNILEKNIEDVANNTTRFFVIGAIDVPASGHDSTSLLTSVPHKPGGLRQLLTVFEDAGISMTRIESRPSRNDLWEYNFFIDINGHRSDPALADVLASIAEDSPLFRVLGSYPSAL